MGKADLHIHTTYSFDGTASVSEVLASAAQAGLDVIAISDHNEIRGGLEARELASEFGLQVIPGAEISTREGHLVALFVEQALPVGLSLVETLLRVGEQGGIGIAPHPDHPVPNSLPLGSILAALEHPLARRVLQGIEVCNMNPTHSIFNKRSVRAAASLSLARIASSDAHLADMVGAGVTHFEGHTPADLRQAIERRSTLPERVNREWPLLVLLRYARLYNRLRKNRPDSVQGMDPLSSTRSTAR
jgi:predicted metal-dependent phosphoesterase TrpH